jgi:hypothetical protein
MRLYTESYTMHTEDDLVVDRDVKPSEERGDQKPKLKISPHVDPNYLAKLSAALPAEKKPRPVRAARKKKRKRRQHQARAPPDDPDAYTIDEFCRRHMISRPTYNRLRASGRGPREIKLDQKVLITKEAAADWRREREAASAA